MPDFLYEHRVTIFVIVGIFLSLFLFRVVVGEIRRAMGGKRQQLGLSVVRYFTSRHPILLLSLLSLVVILIVIIGLISQAVSTPSASVFIPADSEPNLAILIGYTPD